MNSPVGKPAETASTQETHAGVEQDKHAAPSVVRSMPRRPTSEEIRAQLERLIASPRFASSPRCQVLLRYVVETTLSGKADTLKERNIGVDVFKRNPDYDTNADPAVRVAVSEIRKKLAQYYYDPGNQYQVRIEMPIGSYAPVFSLPESAPLTATEIAHSGPALPEQSKKVLRSRTFVIASVAVCVLAIVAGVFFWRAATAKTPLELFWAPVLNSPNPVLICPGQLRSTQVALNPDYTNNPTGWVVPLGSESASPKSPPVFVVSDAITLVNITASLRSEKKPFTIHDEASATYEDLQKGPVILVGSFVNHWTIFLTRSMPYQFVRDPDGYQWISDKKNPTAKIGLSKIDEKSFGKQEFGLVARIIDSETKQPTMIIAGVTPTGTLAAGEFVTNPQLLGDFLKTAPANWQTRNMEIVLSANVIDDQPGPPHVVASTVW